MRNRLLLAVEWFLVVSSACIRQSSLSPPIRLYICTTKYKHYGWNPNFGIVTIRAFNEMASSEIVYTWFNYFNGQFSKVNRNEFIRLKCFVLFRIVFISFLTIWLKSHDRFEQYVAIFRCVIYFQPSNHNIFIFHIVSSYLIFYSQHFSF